MLICEIRALVRPGGEWRSLVMEIVLTTILVSVILDTATGRAASGTTPRSRWVRPWPARAVRQPDQRCLDESSPHAGALHRQRDFTGWWVYVVGDIVGAAIAVVLIILVRDMPRQAEREAAEGGDVRVP